MSAYLDSQRNHGDRSGGVSDPRLTRQLDTLGPVLQNTPEELATVTRLIAHHSPDIRTAQDIAAMILPNYAHEQIKEAA